MNGKELKIEKEFVYLGCKVTSKGRWSSHVDLMDRRGLRAMWSVLRSSLRKIGLNDIKLMKRIFDSRLR